MVRGFIAVVTPEELAASRRNPWVPQDPETTLACLQARGGWEHLRYVVRDVDAIA
jgi:hypothetical protein